MEGAATMSAHILIVDQNHEAVGTLRDTLMEAGNEIRVATSCAEGRSIARGWLEVALVDLQLPDGDGTALASQLKEDTPDCEVVLMTGNGSLESAVAAVRAGVWAYLMKPCATEDLLSTLDKAVRHVKALEEKRDLMHRAHVAEKLAAVGTLTAGLSHEIRNPLNAAVLQLAVLERRIRKLDDDLQPPLMDPLSIVRDEIRRLEHILQDFLQFARPAPPSLAPTSISVVLDRVAGLLEADAQRRGVVLELRLANAPSVMADADQLRQVFMNLTLNAMDAAGAHGRVLISCDTESIALNQKNLIAINVDDSGSGISPEVAARVFEPFFTTKEKGSGLGLPISHAVITQHGGSIQVGRSPLGGARMRVLLPKR